MREDNKYRRAHRVEEAPEHMHELLKTLKLVMFAVQDTLENGAEVTLAVRFPEMGDSTGLFVSTEDRIGPVAEEMLRAEKAAGDATH